MRTDIDKNSVARVHLIGTERIEFPNGAAVEPVDYTGYRATDLKGATKLFLALQAGDLSHDWVDITEHKEKFIVSVTGAELVDDRPVA